MRTHRRTRRSPGVAGKGSHPRLRSLRTRRAGQGKLKEHGRTSEGVAKRRLRSIKRETGGGRAIRGNRTRQRRT